MWTSETTTWRRQRTIYIVTFNRNDTRTANDDIILHIILSGLAFSDIENILRQHLWNRLAERCKTYNLHFPNSKKLFPSNLEEDVKQIWKEPSNDFIESVFLADFMDKENLYTARMVDIDIGPNEWVSMDHTFKVACNIGLKRKSDSKWETLYDSLFCVMNEKGQVMGWQFNKGTSFESVRKLLQGIKKRCDKKKQIVRSCYIDNCCAWRKKLQGIFTSNCSVKLDLFHAVSIGWLPRCLKDTLFMVHVLGISH